MVGFGESISALIHQDSIWISRAIAVGVLLLLLGNLASAFIFSIHSLIYSLMLLQVFCGIL